MMSDQIEFGLFSDFSQGIGHPLLPERTPKRENARERWARIKTAGGAEYQALLAKGRASRKLFRQRHPGYWKVYAKKNGMPFKTSLCANARDRGRKRGLAATIRPEDLVWPTHCPVLGIELNYPVRTGQRKNMRAEPNWPSLDRYDPTKGYVPGNVFVISFRANTLKSNATFDEILKIARYISKRPRYG